MIWHSEGNMSNFWSLLNIVFFKDEDKKKKKSSGFIEMPFKMENMK